MNHYVTPAIAKETLDVSLATLRRWAKAGKIKHFRTPGGQFRYDLASVGIDGAHAAHGAQGKLRGARGAEMDHGARGAQEIDTGRAARNGAHAAQVIVSPPVEAPPAAKPMPQAPIQPRLDPAALRRAVEGLARASAV